MYTTPWHGCCSLFSGSSDDHRLHLTRGPARRQSRKTGLGLELISPNQAVPVEHVWAERMGCRSKSFTLIAAKERVGYHSQLLFSSFLQRQPAPLPDGICGAGARTGGRGMTGLSKPGNKEMFPFPACWDNPLGWCELSSIWINCEWTVCLRSGERDLTNNNIQSFWNIQLRNYGLSF